MILDIYSRYAVGWMVATRESAVLAEKLIAATCAKQGIARGQLTIHADRGSSMTSKPVAFLLADLGVTQSHSRPHVSNDNPYSEAQFKTLKYRPGFPGRFASIEDARAHCQDFFRWYNHEHRHSGLGLHTAADVHYGQAAAVQADRAQVLTAAYPAHPERFVRKPPATARTARAHPGSTRPRTEGDRHSVKPERWCLIQVDRFREGRQGPVGRGQQLRLRGPVDREPLGQRHQPRWPRRQLSSPAAPLSHAHLNPIPARVPVGRPTSSPGDPGRRASTRPQYKLPIRRGQRTADAAARYQPPKPSASITHLPIGRPYLYLKAAGAKSPIMRSTRLQRSAEP